MITTQTTGAIVRLLEELGRLPGIGPIGWAIGGLVVVVPVAPVGCGGSSFGVEAQPASARPEVSSSAAKILRVTGTVSLVNHVQTALHEANRQSVSIHP